jgi:hypothetical protein
MKLPGQNSHAAGLPFKLFTILILIFSSKIATKMRPVPRRRRVPSRASGESETLRGGNARASLRFAARLCEPEAHHPLKRNGAQRQRRDSVP